MKKKTSKPKADKNKAPKGMTVESIRKDVAALAMALGIKSMQLKAEPVTTEMIMKVQHNKQMSEVLAVVMIELAKIVNLGPKE
jgi:hypothetical protein